MRAPLVLFTGALALAGACRGRPPAGDAPSASVTPSAGAPSAAAAPSAPAPSVPAPRGPVRPARHAPAEAPEGYLAAQVHGVINVHHSDVVLLVAPGGERAVPIFVSPTEALSIKLRQQQVRYERPLTHDLLDSLVERLGGEVYKAHVDELRGTTFVARVFVWQGETLIDLDARPSDAIAIALGNHVPLFIAKRVLEAAGVERKNLGAPLPPARDPSRPPPREPMAL